MSRSLKKELYVNEKLLEKVKKANQEKKIKVFKTWARNSVISPEMIGHTLLIHNGKKFLSRQVTQDIVGYKIGEFAPTRQLGRHGKSGKH